MADARYPIPPSNPNPLSTVSRVVGGLVPAAGVVIALASPGASNQGRVYQAIPQPIVQQVSLGSRLFRVSVPPVVFTDSGSGTITLSGSGSETFVPAPTQLAVALAGGGNASLVSRKVPREVVPETSTGSRALAALAPSTSTTFTDSGSGSITLSGTGVEAFSVSPPPLALQNGTQAVLRAPVPVESVQSLRTSRLFAATPAVVFTDSGSGSITLSGSGVESFVPAPTQLSVSLAGGSNVNRVVLPVPREVVPNTKAVSTALGALSGSTSVTYTDSGSGTITLSGSGVEVFVPPPIRFTRAVPREIVPATTSVSTVLGALDAGGRGYAPAVSVAPGVIVAGTSNQSLSTQAVPQPPPWEQKAQQANVYFGYNAAPPTYSVIVAGSTNQGYQMHKPAPAEAPVSPLGSRFFTQPAAVVFTDSGTGTITLSGTGVESFATPPPRLVRPGQSAALAGVVPADVPQVLLGSRALFKPRGFVSFVDSGTGTITLSGSTVESASGTGSGTGTLTLSGTRTESLSTADTGSGSITLSGTKTDSWSATGAMSGTIVLDGSATSNDGFAAYAAVNIDAPYVLSVHPLKTIADQRKWRRLTREVLGEDLLVYGLPMSAFGSSIVYVVWNLDENQIVSVHESSQQATDAIRRRLTRTGRGNYVVYTMDT